MTGSLTTLVFALVISITGIIVLTRFLNVHAFFSLLLAALTFGMIMGRPLSEILSTMQSGFGSLLQQIGFLVALGSCLGIMLEKTGAMLVISERTLRLFGARHSVLGMSLIGAVVGIPVFCDSGFIILSRMVPSIAVQTGVNPAQLSLALSSGLYTTHTLVPPTPGPLAAAANLGMGDHLATVILVGLVASVPVTLTAYFVSKKLGAALNVQADQIAVSTQQRVSAFAAFVPLMLPILLITSSNLPKVISPLMPFESFFSLVGHPVVALAIGLACSFFLITKSQKKEWPDWLSAAIKDAGVILLITGAGGAFGSVIKASGIDSMLKDLIGGSQTSGIVFLSIGFAMASVLKTAQGSTTSAIIITSSLLAPLTSSAGFVTPLDFATLMVAIGGGAMTVSHANDSYFWVVSQFGGITPRDAFRTFTLVTLAQGTAALLTSIALFVLL